MNCISLSCILSDYGWFSCVIAIVVESMKVLLEYTGILEPFQAMLEAPQEVEVIQRVKGNKKYFFVLNYMGSEQKIVLKKQMRSLYDNVIANGEICMKPYETIVYEVLE